MARIPLVAALVLGAAAAAPALAQPAPCPAANLMYWQAFPPGGESDISARHQQVVLKKKCPAIDTVIQYRAGAGGAVLWSQANVLPADGFNVVGINLPHMVLQPMEGKVSYKTDDVTPVYWFHYTPDLLVVPESSPIKSFADFIKAAQGRAGPAQPRRLGPQLGQPRGARAARPRLRHQDHLRAVQGHRRSRASRCSAATSTAP